MARLSKEQELFLKAQKISLSMLMDGSGLSKSEREALMTELGHKFYYGGAQCKAAGHTLRTKAGHCIQCDTSKIAYQLRSSASGYVYIAQSLQNNFIKIGFSEVDPYNRVTWLQASNYGNVNDWNIVKSTRIDQNAGKCEFEIHSALEQWRHPVIYDKNGVEVECREIFACSLAQAQPVYERLVTTYA